MKPRKHKYDAAAEFAQGRVVVARFREDGKRLEAWRMTPEEAFDLVRRIQSAASRVECCRDSREILEDMSVALESPILVDVNA